MVIMFKGDSRKRDLCHWSTFWLSVGLLIDLLQVPLEDTQHKGPVKLIKRLKIAHSFLQSVSNQFHVIILSLPM